MVTRDRDCQLSMARVLRFVRSRMVRLWGSPVRSTVPCHRAGEQMRLQATPRTPASSRLLIVVITTIALAAARCSTPSAPSSPVANERVDVLDSLIGDAALWPHRGTQFQNQITSAAAPAGICGRPPAPKRSSINQAVPRRRWTEACGARAQIPRNCPRMIPARGTNGANAT